MIDYLDIYNTQAAQYERLVAREDHKGHLLPALEEIRPFSGLAVVESGAGTGRLATLLAPLVARILVCDIMPAMLAIAEEKRQREGWHHWQPAVADHRYLPIAAETADVVLVGWSLSHFSAWYPQSWQQEIGTALAEMERVLRSNGTLIIIETLGTNSQTPHPPAAHLAAYYRWLEQEQGFASTWIRTDYRFASLAEAQTLIRFFFGEEMATSVVRKGSPIVAECTGIWWR